MAAKPLARQIAELIEYARRWGVTVHLRDHALHLKSCSHLHHGPQAGVIDWSDRSIWFGSDINFSPTDPCALLHEIAHCLDDVTPTYSDEVGSFMLAFEAYSCRWLRLTGRRQWMYDFGVGDDLLWSEISTARRSALIAASLKDAVERGLLTQDGKPTFRRDGRDDRSAR